jgi:hypothetical protein
MMSKYNMLIFLLSAMLYMSVSKENRKYFTSKGFWTACVIAGIIFLPNVIWNFNNGLVSFLHTKENAHGSGFSLHPDKMLEFIGAQFGVFGPIFFGCLLFIIGKIIKTRKITEDEKLLLCFTLPLLLLIITISLISRAHANWAAPVYVPATVLVTAWLVKNSKTRLIRASLYIHIFAAFLLTNFYLIDKFPAITIVGSKTDLSQGKIKDPFKRVHGWKDLGEGAIVLSEAYPEATILTDSRKIHSELLYYARPHAFDAVKWNPTGKKGDHYELTTDINKAKSKDFIYITYETSAHRIDSYFESAERIGNIHISPYSDYDIDFYAYYMKGFKGYDAVE